MKKRWLRRALAQRPFCLVAALNQARFRSGPTFWLRRNGCVNMMVAGTFTDQNDRGRFIKNLIDMEMYRVGALKGLDPNSPPVRRA